MPNYERQKGQAFWVRAQYGGGKTHFLATLAALLSGSDEVWDRVSDAEIIAWRRQLANIRLFPVVFSLRGKGAASADVAESLYDIFEDEVKRAAEDRLQITLRLSTEDEVLAWWSELAGGIRAELNGWVSQRLGRTADDLRGSPVEFKEAVLLAAEAHHIRVPLRGRTEQRLRVAFDQVVNSSTGYTGLLVIIDEFAFWQDQHPENSPAAARDEEFLETLGWSLPKTADLPIYTIVASQRRQPAKLLAGQNEGRFISVEISSARDATVELWEYEQIVSHRVRELDPERVPEIEEYFQDSARRFEFAASLDLHRFRVLFPVEPTCYEILQRITESLAAERVGINVLWEVLGEESEGGPSVRRDLLVRRRLITAPDLLASPSLRAALTEPAYQDRFKILEVARDGLQHFSDLDDDERGLAERLVDTLFLWDLAFLRAPKPMAIDTLAGAVLAEAGMYNDASEAVDSVLQVIKDLEQIEYDAGQGTVQFVARAQIGRSAQQIFEEFRRRPLTETQIESAWRSFLLDRQLDQNGLTALFSGLTVGQADKQPVIWEQVEYDGRQIVLDYWRGAYGRPSPTNSTRSTGRGAIAATAPRRFSTRFGATSTAARRAAPTCCCGTSRWCATRAAAVSTHRSALVRRLVPPGNRPRWLPLVDHRARCSASLPAGRLGARPRSSAAAPSRYSRATSAVNAGRAGPNTRRPSPSASLLLGSTPSQFHIGTRPRRSTKRARCGVAATARRELPGCATFGQSEICVRLQPFTSR